MSKNYSSNKAITLSDMWKVIDIEVPTLTAVVSVLFGGFVTALLASTFSLFFLFFAIVPVSVITLSFTAAFKHALNDVVVVFSNYNSATEKAFNKRETVKVLLHIPFKKNLACGIQNVHPIDAYGRKEYGITRGTQTLSVKNIKGKIHMIRDYQESPGWKWEDTFKLATRNN